MDRTVTKKLIFSSGILASLVFAVLIGLAGSDGGSAINGVPIFIACGLVSFILQWVAFVPAFAYQTEKYFDLMGSVTYITLAVVTLLLSTREPGAWAITLMVVIWAGRLGSFLFIRIAQAGEDKRFRAIKPDFLQFLMTWTIQGLWVFITFAAGLAALTSGRDHPIDAVVATGILIWIIGFSFEVIADRQKTKFRSDAANTNRFIRQGLWAWSRHPNYFGEILLWTGIAIAAYPVLAGWQLATLISPVFVVVLLTKISGVRMLEFRAKKQWGEDPEFVDYLRQTPMLIPNPFLSGKS